MSDSNLEISRRKLLQSALLSLTILSGSTLSSANAAGIGEDKIRKPVILGYLPSWKDVDPAQLEMGLYTHICHAFAEVSKTGPLRFPSEDQTRKLISAAHAKQAKVLISIGGADSNAALSANKTEDLADQLVKRVHDFHYDGVDVDWEAPENPDQSGRTSALVQLLRKRLPKALITMAVSADDYSGKRFITEDLLPYVDWMNIMTYDYCGPWVDTVLHNAPLPEVIKSIAYWKSRGWPAEKLMLGIPNYGRRIHATHFGDPAPKGTYVGDEVDYIEAVRLIKSGWKPMLDADAQSPYIVKPSGDEMITYEDEASAKRKGHLAMVSGLRGFFFWEITSDFDGKSNILARAANQGWNQTV